MVLDKIFTLASILALLCLSFLTVYISILIISDTKIVSINNYDKNCVITDEKDSEGNLLKVITRCEYYKNLY